MLLSFVNDTESQETEVKREASTFRVSVTTLVDKFSNICKMIDSQQSIKDSYIFLRFALKLAEDFKP